MRLSLQPGNLKPDPLSHQELRSEFARRAIKGYGADGAASDGDAIPDLITDLLHLADSAGLDVLSMLEAAIGNWSAEKRNPDNPGDADSVKIYFQP